jgi:xylan 1,4-beta-xylosidase
MRTLLMMAAFFLAACAAPTSIPAQDEDSWAYFDWFEYAGADPIYEDLQVGTNQYLNPIIKGYHPDPSIVRVGADFYMVHSSFAHFPGIPLWHSRDLVNWDQIGHVLDRPSQLDLDGLEISHGIFAPAIRHDDGVFYVVTTNVYGGGNFIVRTDDPGGSWTDPYWLEQVDGIDPSIFFDDDGRVWMLNNGPPQGEPLYEGHRALWIQEFDLERMDTFGPRTMIVDGGVDITTEPIWIEAPHMFKVDGHYYLIAAEGGTGYNHSEVVFRSDNVTGPWTPFEGNPILTQRHLDPNRTKPVTSVGHADFVQLADGSWWTTFLGTRPYDGDLYNTGRETFLLPVEWRDGWPIILEGDAEVPYVHERPPLPDAGPASTPHSGNFTHRDDFDSDVLHPMWTFIRTPRENWHSLSRRTGNLAIRARDAQISDRAQPSFIGRRQQHINATATTRLNIAELLSGSSAGIAAFQNDDFYYYLGVARSGEEYIIQLAGKSGAGDATILASAPLEEIPGEVLLLRITASGAAYSFEFGVDSQDGWAWHMLLDDVDGTSLSTSRAGGFVGTFFGMHAVKN